MTQLHACLLAAVATLGLGFTALATRAEPAPVVAEAAPTPFTNEAPRGAHWKCIPSANGGEVLVCQDAGGNTIAGTYCAGQAAPVCATRPR